MATKDKLLSTMELAKTLQVTIQSIYLWRAQGCPHIKLGEKTYRYNLQDVIDWRVQYVKNPKNGADGNGK